MSCAFANRPLERSAGSAVSKLSSGKVDFAIAPTSLNGARGVEGNTCSERPQTKPTAGPQGRRCARRQPAPKRRPFPSDTSYRLAQEAEIPIASEHPTQIRPCSPKSAVSKKTGCCADRANAWADCAIPACARPSIDLPRQHPRRRNVLALFPVRSEGVADQWLLSTPWVRLAITRPLPHGFTSAPKELLECCPTPPPTIHRNWFGHLRPPSK